ncbi:thiosulfate ABC transporter substrate-binding protein CysP [Candidatus Blochmannia ocreatus (nom. nud.)]
MILEIIKIIVFFCYLFCNMVDATILLNSSYDVSRELFLEINTNFIKYWNSQNSNTDNRDTLIIRQSHAGSTRQAMTVLQGLRADVVTYNQVIDVQILHDRGKLIPSDWQKRFPNNSSPFYSTMAFLVRKGNPKKIYDWCDLVKPGVEIVFPNPKVSGNGRYTYLAAWYAFFLKNNGNLEKTRALMQQFLKNVIAFDIGGRVATATFVDRYQGDVLINFESEVKFVQNLHASDVYEIVIPYPNVLVEFPVTWIDKNVARNGTKDVAQAYLAYLYTPEAQKSIEKFGYRICTSSTNSGIYYNTSFINQLFRIEEKFGNWNVIMDTHFKHGGELDRLLLAGRT